MPVIRWLRACGVLLAAAMLSQPCLAEQLSMVQRASFLQDRAPLVQPREASREPAAQRGAGSLFAGQQGTSLFARRTVQRTLASRLVQQGGDATQIERIRHLIGQAEAGRHGYDAVQHGAKKRPARRPTEMTVAEIYDWIAATPGQPHAIGRYQFIPVTLRRLVDMLGVEGDAVFSRQLQDDLADALLVEAGLNAFSRGDIGRHDFMNNMAKIWAGLPTSSGRSHYDGYAGNKSTMTWAHFDTEMGKIFPG